MAFCSNCGNQLNPGAKFCDKCGCSIPGNQSNSTNNNYNPNTHNSYTNGQSAIHCPACGSTNIDIQTFQEQKGTASVGGTQGTYGEGKHGCLWWVFIGWWWETLAWIYLFPVKLIIAIFRKKRKGSFDAATASYAHNIIDYKTVCTCKNCGNHWKK